MASSGGEPFKSKKSSPPYLLIAFGATVAFAVFTEIKERFADRVIVRPTSSAAEGASNALDPDNIDIPKTRELPVWPPPSATTPVDPAANPMSGALPMRVDWPDASAAHPSKR